MPPVNASAPEARDTMPGQKCQTIDDVIAKLTQLEAELAPAGTHDGVIYFNRLYLEVTKRVKAAVEGDGFFTNPQAIAQLDVIFARLYFDALDDLNDGKKAPRAWQLLFDARMNADVLAIQFAVAGMNAHIDHDLSIALVEQWVADTARPRKPGDLYADYTKINDILGQEIDIAKTELEPRDLQKLDKGDLARLDDKLSMYVVADARARAWTTADALWDVRHLPLGRDAVMAEVDLASAALGSALLTPLF